ncbi:MAG: Hsp20/alpha crystallin family protein [Mycobacteriales bacterium]
MAVTRWDPFMTLARLDDFDNLVRRTWGTGTKDVQGSGFVPAVELISRGDDVLIRLELPGVDPANDLDIEVAPGKLTVRGERKALETTGNDSALVRELRYGSFHRQFALPEGIDDSGVDAHYENGMLEVLVRNVVRRPPEPKKIHIRKGEHARSVETAHAEAAPEK